MLSIKLTRLRTAVGLVGASEVLPLTPFRRREAVVRTLLFHKRGPTPLQKRRPSDGNHKKENRPARVGRPGGSPSSHWTLPNAFVFQFAWKRAQVSASCRVY